MMQNLEKTKYMKPHFSRCLEPIIQYLNERNDYSISNNHESQNEENRYLIKNKN